MNYLTPNRRIRLEKILLEGIPTQMVLSGSALPIASATYRGKTFTVLGGTNIADKPYICTKNADETYSWKPTTGFSW